MKKTYIDKKGYHRFIDSDKLVHRWVSGKKHSKEELTNKEVHHIDGDKSNNNKNNLIILNKEDHHDLTNYESRKDFISSLIIVLGVVYVISIILTAITNNSGGGFLTIARLSVVFIIFLAIELKKGIIGKAIRKPRGDYQNEQH